MIKMIPKKTGIDGDDQVFALKGMQREQPLKKRSFSVMLDKAAEKLSLARGFDCFEPVLKKVVGKAAEKYGNGMKTWELADESTHKTFFSKEGDPTYIALILNTKLETIGIEAFGVDDSLFLELRRILE